LLTPGTEEVGAVHNSLLYIAMHTNHLSGGTQAKSITAMQAFLSQELDFQSYVV